MAEILTRIQKAKTRAKRVGGSPEAEQLKILNNLREKLKEFSQLNPREANALLEHFKQVYPTFRWDD
jgi:hypothetical protein